MWFIKTHELRHHMQISEQDKVIYLVRDGRASTLSFTKHLQNFYGKKNDDLGDVLHGNTPYGSWGEHVMGWINTPKLLIKFEELIDHPEETIGAISQYLKIDPKGGHIPTFEELQKINPKFFRSGKKDGWKTFFSDDEHLLFWLRNHKPMQEMGYMENIPKEVNQTSFKTYARLFTKEIEVLKNSHYSDIQLQQKIKTIEKQNTLLKLQLKKTKESRSYRLGNLIATPYRTFRKYFSTRSGK